MYRDIDAFLRGNRNVKVIILDSNNLQFYFQHRDILTLEHVFAPYDVVIIPGWVYAEFSGSADKLNYLNQLTIPYFIIDEFDDYLEMIEYNDQKLMELFRSSSLGSETQKFFNIYRKFNPEDLPDNWIRDLYDTGFPTRTTPSGDIARKNAGEVSIITLTFLLLSHYKDEIESISIASSDFAINKMKTKVAGNISEQHLQLSVKTPPPISIVSTDVSMCRAYTSGIIDIHNVRQMRHVSKSVIYVQTFADNSSQVVECVADNTAFEEFLFHPDRYFIIF